MTDYTAIMRVPFLFRLNGSFKRVIGEKSVGLSRFHGHEQNVFLSKFASAFFHHSAL